MPQSTPHSFPRYEDPSPNVGRVDDNSCAEGTVAGGLLGAHWAEFFLRKKTGFGQSPLALLEIAMVGCQVDGGIDETTTTIQDS